MSITTTIKSTNITAIIIIGIIKQSLENDARGPNRVKEV
jgi:hypothetical protein